MTKDDIKDKLKVIETLSKEECMDLLNLINENPDFFDTLTIGELRKIVEVIAKQFGISMDELTNKSSDDKNTEEEDEGTIKLYKIVIEGYLGNEAGKTAVIVALNKLLTPDLNIPANIKTAEWSLTKIKEKILGVSGPSPISFDFPGEYPKNDEKLKMLIEKLTEIKLVVKMKPIN